MATTPDDDDDTGEVTAPGDLLEEEIEWEEEEEPLPLDPAEFGGVVQTDLEAGTLRQSVRDGNPMGGIITLVILFLMIMAVLCAASESLIWQLAALTIMIAVPAIAAVGIMAWRAATQKKETNKSTPTPTSVGK